jgi:hypothetical protein
LLEIKCSAKYKDKSLIEVFSENCYHLYLDENNKVSLVEWPNRRSYFWKGTTQGSFQQNLVEIGSVVSEKIFLNFIPFFSIFRFVAILVGRREEGMILEISMGHQSTTYRGMQSLN